MKFVMEFTIIIFAVLSAFLAGFSTLAFINNHIDVAIYLLMCSVVSWRIAEGIEKQKDEYYG